MAAQRIDRVERDGLVLDVTDSGPRDGPIVVLLHGWPADSSCWSEVTPRLVDAGLRVLALDQRGTAPGARPRGRRAYRMPELVADVVALLDRLGDRAVHLVGHDWGGAVAWSVAAGPAADRLASLTVLSTPHPRAMARSLVTSPQLLRSTYIGLFQLPVLPEALLGARGGTGLRTVLRRSGLGADHTDRYVERLRPADARRASLGWYRALPLAGGDVAGPVRVPTTYVWSTGDTALDRRAAERTGDHVTGPYRFEVVEGAPHWLPEERPALVADLVVAQVRSPSTAAGPPPPPLTRRPGRPPRRSTFLRGGAPPATHQRARTSATRFPRGGAPPVTHHRAGTPHPQVDLPAR